ncbi:MAG: DUF1499 domain-containing protein [Aquisalinus sp.]|nr:DUF1499 domain-containing protein [Aquisalinus sp.]
MIDFQTLKRSHKPNNYLVADKAHCPNARPDRQAPVLPHEPEAVLAAWQAVIAQQPRTTQTDYDSKTMTFEYVQRSALLRFPDTITVRFLPEADGSEIRVLVYSSSKIGYSDMGVNRRRVTDWLSALEQELAA